MLDELSFISFRYTHVCKHFVYNLNAGFYSLMLIKNTS